MIAYSSTDAGAPVLSGTIGAMIALLDACLVTGYGSKAGAGWTKPFSGPNKAVYKMGGGSQRYLNLDDSAAVAASVRGYEVMTAQDTGTEAFPTTVQVAAPGLYFVKSDVASASTRYWRLWANDKYFILYVSYNSSAGLTNAANPVVAFGDIQSNKAGDLFNTILIANTNTAYTGSAMGLVSTDTLTTKAGHYITRSYTGLGTAKAVGKHTHCGLGHNSYLGSTTTVSNFPDPVTGGILVSPLWIHEAGGGLVRGVLPAIWDILHPVASMSVGDTFNGSGTLAGKTFMVIAPGGTSQPCKCAIEISDTWG